MMDRTPRNEANTLPEIQDALSKIDTGQDALIEIPPSPFNTKTR